MLLRTSEYWTCHGPYLSSSTSNAYLVLCTVDLINITMFSAIPYKTTMNNLSVRTGVLFLHSSVFDGYWIHHMAVVGIAGN